MSRVAIVISMLAAGALVAEPAWHDNAPAFLWNASASAPIGLYRLAPATPVDIGDLIVVMPPTPLANFLAGRGYLPRGVPLLKRVVALAGTTVCRVDTTIVVDGRPSGTALARDSRGRPLPVWQGCRTLARGEVFVMNADVPDSLDSRYFGPLPVSTIIARALPVFTPDDGDGRFHWHVGAPAAATSLPLQPPA